VHSDPIHQDTKSGVGSIVPLAGKGATAAHLPHPTPLGLQGSGRHDSGQAFMLVNPASERVLVASIGGTGGDTGGDTGGFSLLALKHAGARPSARHLWTCSKEGHLLTNAGTGLASCILHVLRTKTTMLPLTGTIVHT
jgi:hypothetical protein